jgi:phosphoserine phosphatase RsbX
VETINQPVVEWGVASRAHKGQTESADRPLVRIEPGYALVGAVDGLGYGEEAASAANAAIQTLESAKERSVIELLDRCHARLLPTRGVVMSIAMFNTVDSTMTWAGVGNVEGFLLRTDSEASPRYESLLLRNGVVGARMPFVVGARMPFIHAAIVPVMRGDMLIFSTDGIRSDYRKNVRIEQPPQQIADQIMAQSYTGTDDALVLVVRYRGGVS